MCERIAEGILTMDALSSSLSLLFAELTDGPSPDAAYMLNGGDPGLLRSLDGLSAEAASRQCAPGGASIAAHVDHLCYGLDLMNRWSDGEADPWSWRGLDGELAPYDGHRERVGRPARAASPDHEVLARGPANPPRDVSTGAERRHRQRRASGLSPGRHQANRPIGSGSEGRSRMSWLNGTRISQIGR